MKRAVIPAKGKVQRVGYLDDVEEIARSLEITGFVETSNPTMLESLQKAKILPWSGSSKK